MELKWWLPGVNQDQMTLKQGLAKPVDMEGQHFFNIGSWLWAKSNAIGY